MKKIIGTMLVFILVFSYGVDVHAASEKTYEEVLIAANEVYDLDLTYIEVDDSMISVEKYEKIVFDVAKQQRELLNYIESKEEYSVKSFNEYAVRSGVSKTRTKSAWNYDPMFKIRATYTDYGTRVSSCSSSSVYTNLVYALSYGVSLSNISSPSYGLIDQGETATVTYTATYNVDLQPLISNITLYAEFYAGE
jgi:hypothetical protein